VFSIGHGHRVCVCVCITTCTKYKMHTSRSYNHRVMLSDYKEDRLSRGWAYFSNCVPLNSVEFSKCRRTPSFKYVLITCSGWSWRCCVLQDYFESPGTDLKMRGWHCPQRPTVVRFRGHEILLPAWNDVRCWVYAWHIALDLYHLQRMQNQNTVMISNKTQKWATKTDGYLCINRRL